MKPFTKNRIKIFVPYSKLVDATLIALIGYDYETVETKGLYGYAKFFRERWQEGQSFINIEHDSVVWPGAIEALQECPEPWCAYDSSLPCLRDRDMHHETTSPPLACTKISAEMIKRTENLWDKLEKWETCDIYIGNAAKNAGLMVHQHWPSIVNANNELLKLVNK